MISLECTPKNLFALVAILFLVLSTFPVADAAPGLIRNEHLIVEFDEPLDGAAREVTNAYPAIKAELERTFTWSADFVPVISLMKDSESFRKMAGSASIVALAVPHRNLIVIDYSRMKSPFTLDTTLKHEMCHLMLHHHIGRDSLPRWLDEGVCQWVSGGAAEIMVDTGKTDLEGATLSKKLLPLSQLTAGFPGDPSSLSLAYQESRSFIEYMNNEFGSSRLLTLLEHLRKGSSIEEAFEKGFSASLVELEKNWHDHLKKRITWMTYVSNNVYEILFVFGGLLTVYGFIRIIRRRRAYRDEDDEEGEEEAEEGAPTRSLRSLKRGERGNGKPQ